jgi:hypothetical protein
VSKPWRMALWMFEPIARWTAREYGLPLREARSLLLGHMLEHRLHLTTSGVVVAVADTKLTDLPRFAFYLGLRVAPCHLQAMQAEDRQREERKG